MHLILSEVWMDHPVGTELVLTDSFAKTLLERGVAKEVKEEAKAKEEPIEKEIEQIDNDNGGKTIESPQFNKMLKLIKRK